MAHAALELGQADAAALQRILEAAMAPVPAPAQAVAAASDAIEPELQGSRDFFKRGLRWLYLSFGASAEAVWCSPPV